MKISGKKLVVILTTIILMTTDIISFKCDIVYAKESKISIDGSLYFFGEDPEYNIDTSNPKSTIKNQTKFGSFSVTGNLKPIESKNNVPSYEVTSGNVQLSYELGSVYDTADEFSWHYAYAPTKKVNGESLGKDIDSGAVVLQTSFDGKNWVTDLAFTDVTYEDSEYVSDFYKTSNIQQVNGCYYRVIVAYMVEKVTKKNKLWFDDSVWENYAEVYTFYLVNDSENTGNTTSAATTPRKEMGEKVNTGKDNGYSGKLAITSDDPHYGWDIGTFTVNGYTRETVDGDVPVFLKNVGDKVTLWFTLKQDIKCLNGNSKLYINEDKDGEDQHFEISKTNLRHGALIIQYTDYENVVHKPVIYTDYLAANTRTNADTKVELFEEGDYEVALDYEIKNTEGINSVSDYKISFKFKIRNGNSMVYPFDVESGKELSDGAITSNGFKLDMAKSRYLTIDVERAVVGLDGELYKRDVRFSRPAKDGDEYTDEGVYTFTVKNLYTDSAPMTKTIYVGDSPIMKAMASTKKSVEEINELLSEGAILDMDGTISFPVIEEPEPEPEPEVTSETSVDKSEEVVPFEPKAVDEEQATKTVPEPEENNTEMNLGGNVLVIAMGAVIVVLLLALVIVLSGNKKKQKKLEAQLRASDETKKEIENDSQNNEEEN